MFSTSFVDSSSTLFSKCGVSPILCNSNTVLKMLCDLRTDKASGSDNIPPFLKVIARDICVPLSHIFNLSFAHAYVPDLRKIADIPRSQKC